MQWEIAVHDLAPVLARDSNGDGLIPWPEIRARGTELAIYATAYLSVAVNAMPWVAGQADLAATQHAGTEFIFINNWCIKRAPR